MKLKVRLHPRPTYIVGTVLAIFVGFFFLRTALWEKAYYDAKEGSARAVAVSTSPSSTATVEVPPSEDEIREHFVPDGYPRYLSIPSLGITNARILSVGTTEDGAIATPVNIYDAAWYLGSSLPGSGGTIVINGHNGADQVGIFKNLSNIGVGDEIQIAIGGSDTIYTYSVVESISVPLSDANSYMRTAFSSPIPGQESLTLISCTGRWLYDQDTYDHRLFVRAVLSNF